MAPSRSHRLVTASLAASALVPLAAAQRMPLDPPDAGGEEALVARRTGCRPSWLPTFGPAPDTDGSVYDYAVFEDGSGPGLYAAGDFAFAGSALANHVARWDGARWSALGSGLSGTPAYATEANALAVYDDGSGPALYVGGSFDQAGGVAAASIARWDGARWSSLGSGVDGAVEALTVYDDGSGPALYVGGSFSQAGGVAASSIAKWNGLGWSSVGAGVNSTVWALEAYDDGGGTALYAGGDFWMAGGVAANAIARWSGSSWSALGGGLYSVVALEAFDDGTGASLYAADGCSVLEWNGAGWSAPGSGPCHSSSGHVEVVEALTVFDDGSGPALYAGGLFDFWSVGGSSGVGVAKLDGSTWVQVGNSVVTSVYEDVSALGVYDDGSGASLFLGMSAFPETLSVLALSGASWSPLTEGLEARVNAVEFFDDGTGPALYVGIGGLVVDGVRRWDGSGFASVGRIVGSVDALLDFDDGSGPALYAGGSFFDAEGEAYDLAAWDGGSWREVGGYLDDSVKDLAVFDDGGGPALYVGGGFVKAAGVSANHVARWDGTSWSALGGGLGSSSTYGDHVVALAAHDDGSGPALYAAGRFTSPAGVTSHEVARWDGGTWSVVGGFDDSVLDVTAYDDGGGPALYAAGDFTMAGGVPASGIARWNGSSWSEVGGGVGLANWWNRVGALAVHDDGGGAALYAGGTFTSAGGVAANSIARWNGTSWSAVGAGTNGGVGTLASRADGGGPALYAGGSFGIAYGSGDSYLARWACSDSTAPVPVTRRLR